MAENIRTENGIIATDGSFAQGLKMPMLNAAFNPGRRPGDFGLFGNGVYVRLQDQSVILLSADTNGPWSAVLAVGNTTLGNIPTISAGDQILFQSGIAVGGSGVFATPSPNPGSIAIGGGAGATSNNAVAIGPSATADQLNSTALGYAANTTQANQIMLGNNAIGGTTQVYGDVGLLGTISSSGFLQAAGVVNATKIVTLPFQSIGTSQPFTPVNFSPLISSDYGSPDIASVSNRLFVRLGYVMVGMVQIVGTFAPALGGDIQITARVRFGTGSPVTIAQQTQFVKTGTIPVSFAIPYFIFASAGSQEVFVEIDNPSGTSSLTIGDGSEFTGVYQN